MVLSNEKRITSFLTLLTMWPPSSVQAEEKPTMPNRSSRSLLLPN
jgi:hypothetical protein